MTITLQPRGPAGANGFSVYADVSSPTNDLGRDGEIWINSSTGAVLKKAGGQWRGIGSIKGPRGKDGEAGIAGRTIIYGTEAPPATLGRIGDTYIRDTTFGPVFYGPKGATAWPPGEPIVSVLTGAVPPTSDIGLDGQTYIDLVNFVAYGPKTSGAWPGGGSFVAVLTGLTPPANSLGFNGQTYIDTAHQVIYGPKAGGVWPAGVSFAGLPPLKPIAPWQTGTAYVAGPPSSYVSQNGSSYQCLISHTAGTFATDLGAGKWGLVAQKGVDGTGTGTVNPTGTIVAGRLAIFADNSGTLIADGGPQFTRGQIVALGLGPDSLS